MFDVVIGNPPYQRNVSSKDNFSAVPVYHKFVECAISLSSQYVIMLIPSRWMNGVSKGISEEWLNYMLKENLLREIHDYEDSERLFKSVKISGGVCYFLLDKNNPGECNHIFYDSNNTIHHKKRLLNELNLDFIVRNPSNLPILDKVIKTEDEDYFNSNKSFMSIVSSKGFFSFNGIFNTKFNDYELKSNELYNTKYYITKSKNNFGWIKKDLIKKNAEYVEAHKVIIPFSYGDPKRFDTVLGKPKYSEPYSIASESYLFIGIPSKLTKEECLNVMSYITTKFFRFLVRMKKFTQDAPKGVYQFVPMQDFNKPWTDEELYEKYKLTNDEILLIEKTVKSMTI